MVESRFLCQVKVLLLQHDTPISFHGSFECTGKAHTSAKTVVLLKGIIRLDGRGGDTGGKRA
jgi:hypothetical protein